MGQPEGAAFVSGASGFIGRHLVQALLKQNRMVLALCRRPDSLSDLDHPLLKVICGDLEEPQSYTPHLNEELTVFHLAAARSIQGTSPERMQRINVEASVDLGRASVEARVAKFVYVSSATIYGPSQGNSVTEAVGHSTEHINHGYVRSRVLATGQMKKLADGRMHLVIVCPTIVFGPDHTTHLNRVTSHLRRLLRFGQDVVVGGGHQKRNVVYVDDVVRGILLAENYGDSGEEFILGGDNISHREFNQTALSLAGRKPLNSISLPIGVSRVAARVADVFRGYHRSSGYVADLEMLTTEWQRSSQKAERILGYTSMAVQDAIQKVLEFIGQKNP